MLKYLKKYWIFCLLAPLFMVGEVAMDLIQPDMMADIVDNGVLKSDMELIITVGVRMILFVMLGGFCGVMCGVFANIAAQGFGNDLRKDLFSKIMSLSFQQTDKFSTGSLITRLGNDVTQVQNMVMMAVRGFVRNFVMFFGGILMLYRQSPKFALIAACGLPFVVFFITFFLNSLVHLIPRFYDATEGEILVDGKNVKDYGLTELRDKISIVLQKAELYSRSIESNIRWGKDEATPWEIKKAAEIAQADDFICGSGFGYYTQVTEGGHSLSGGQKQRISIARAVLKEHEILIFDDSTSALDLRTEAQLYEALNRECPDTTKIIIAQRIASVKGADRIAVLDNGRIADIGTHEELLNSSEIYQDIYRSQMKEGGQE